MIIDQFKVNKNGNAVIVVSSDSLSESFTIQTNANLPFAHSVKHQHLWTLTDDDKAKIESEVKNYVSKFGNARQKEITFGKNSARTAAENFFNR